MPTDLPPSLEYSPYFAGLDGKTDEQASALEDRIDGLPGSRKDLLFSESLPEQLQLAAQEAQIPEQYAIAIAKIVFLTILGDIPIGSAEQLLTKLGIAPEKAKMISDKLGVLLAPLVGERAQAVMPKKLEPLPPLTTKIPQRNIIDLRKQQPNAEVPSTPIH